MKLRLFKNADSSAKQIYDTFVFKNVVVLNTKYKASKDNSPEFVVLKINGIVKCDVWKIEYSNIIPEGYIYLNQIQRTYYNLAFGDEIEVSAFTNSNQTPTLNIVLVKLISQGAKKMPINMLNEEFSQISGIISERLQGHIVFGGQPFCINYKDFTFKVEICDKTSRTKILDCHIQITHYNDSGIYIGDNSEIIISSLRIPFRSWNLKARGIGGLKDATQEIFRRAFASRQNVEGANHVGIDHVRGVLLHGPPGCGKTLIARTLAELLSQNGSGENIPPKIVSGPEIFDKYVGGSSDKVRQLFVDAERDKNPDNLHVIIFDEFDSIGAKRTNGESTGDSVGNQVVNQLLSKIEGQQKLNNILLIAMTNRKDAIDEALLRPGRFEVHIEIKLPTLDERKEIIEIHCSKMTKNGAIEESVDFSDLAKRTHNFTGAEINGLIKSAASYALSRTIDVNDEGNIKINSQKPIVTQGDFDKAFHDIKPQFGIQQHRIFQKATLNSVELKEDKEGIIDTSFDPETSDMLLTLGQIYDEYDIPNFISSYQTLCMYMNIKTMSLHERKVGKFALDSKIDCLMCVDYFNMIGMNESQKCIHIKNMYIEASKTSGSLVVINDVNTIIGYNKYNNYFSVAILQTITTLIRYYQNVKSIVTFTTNMNMGELFDMVIKV